MTDETNQAANQMIVDPGHTHGMTWGELAGALSPLRVRPPVTISPAMLDEARRRVSQMSQEEMDAVVFGGPGVAETPIQPAVTELRPPAEHADKPWHWIRHGTTGEACPWQWLDGIWHTPIGAFVGSVDAAALECRPSYLGPAEWRDWSTEKGGDAGEYWAERWHETSLQSEARGRRIRELESAMKHMQVVTPGMWCDADVVAMRARNAELEAENARLAESALAMAADADRQRLPPLFIPMEPEAARAAFKAAWESAKPGKIRFLPYTRELLSASWHHLPCITTGATVPRPAGGFPAQALRGGDGVPR